MKARTPTLEALRGALTAQASSVLDWLAALDPSLWSRESVLTAWSVADLAVHVGSVFRTVHEVLDRPAPGEAPLSVVEFLTGGRAVAAMIHDRDLAGDRGPAEVLALLRAEADRARAALDATVSGTTVSGTAVSGPAGSDAAEPHPAAARAGAVVLSPRGPVRADEYIATRVVELVVHSDDLSRSLPEAPALPVDPGALRIAVRLLASMLVTVAPGRSVEVRIPPYVAVQCVEGPRHTRGTPPNVVETDAGTWIRLATGRTKWTEAVASGAVQASGDRSDLSRYLPVMG